MEERRTNSNFTTCEMVYSSEILKLKLNQVNGFMEENWSVIISNLLHFKCMMIILREIR